MAFPRFLIAASCVLAMANAMDIQNCTKFREEADGFLIDLDGTMYDPRGLVEGAQRFYDYLLKSKKPFVFLSNSGAKGPLGTQTKFLTPPFNITSR